MSLANAVNGPLSSLPLKRFGSHTVVQCGSLIQCWRTSTAQRFTPACSALVTFSQEQTSVVVPQEILNAFGWKKPAHQCKQSWVAIRPRMRKWLWISGPMNHYRWVEPGSQMCHDRKSCETNSHLTSSQFNWLSLQWVYYPGLELRFRLLGRYSQIQELRLCANVAAKSRTAFKHSSKRLGW